MNRAELLAYQRGYYAGTRRNWPDQIPVPPDNVVGPRRPLVQLIG